MKQCTVCGVSREHAAQCASLIDALRCASYVRCASYGLHLLDIEDARSLIVTRLDFCSEAPLDGILVCGHDVDLAFDRVALH